MACACTCTCPGGICTPPPPPPPPPGSRPPCYPSCPTPTVYTNVKPVGVDELVRRLAPSPAIPTALRSGWFGGRDDYGHRGSAP